MGWIVYLNLFMKRDPSMKLATDMHLMLRINSGIFSSFVLFLFPISSPIFYFFVSLWAIWAFFRITCLPFAALLQFSWRSGVGVLSLWLYWSQCFLILVKRINLTATQDQRVSWGGITFDPVVHNLGNSWGWSSYFSRISTFSISSWWYDISFVISGILRNFLK